MRVVGGRWRGHPLEAPRGRDVTRPTTDRARESIASMILSAEGLSLEGISVLDAFAGSGAMGIELLSRGATRCTFIDSDRGACARVRRNLESVGAERGSWRVVPGDAAKVLARASVAGAPFDLVFLDPPYAMPAEDVSRLVAHAAGRGVIARDALVVYERSAKAPGLEIPGSTPIKTKSHGITAVDLLRLGGSDA